MVEFNIYVMFKLCKLFFSLIRSYMIIINHTFIIANRVTLLKQRNLLIYLLIDTIFWIQEINKMFHIYLILKVGNFMYYNIKELVAIRLISIRNWNYLHILDDNFLFGFC